MFHHSFTDEELSEDRARVERAAQEGPVAILADGREAFVLISVEEFRRLTRRGPSLADALHMPGAEDVDLVLPSRRVEPSRPIDWD